jgi:tetratricopeptide (TPR) repeat protein
MTPQNVSLALDYQRTAVEALDQLLELAPTADLYLDKANLFWNNEQIATAREILTKGLARFPDDRGLNLYLANAWLMEGKQDKAAEIFDAYIARFPKDSQAREQFAQVLVELKEYARALDVLKPLPRDKMDSETLFLSAQAESGLGQHRQAIRTLDKVLAKDPEFFDALALMAYRTNLKGLRRAEKGLRQAHAATIPVEVRLRLITWSSS